MTTIIFNSTHEYRLIDELFDKWVRDISSDHVHSYFRDYWNSRFDSPKLDDCAPGQRYRLTFNSEQERTFWLLQNS